MSARTRLRSVIDGLEARYVNLDETAVTYDEWTGTILRSAGI